MGYDFKKQKAELLESLRRKGIHDEAVLRALGVVPRESFINEDLWERAYDDVALPIENRQTISQPYTVAFMTMILQVSPGCKVLEIGTGSGYQAAVLCAMGAEIHTIERIPDLYKSAAVLLKKMDFSVNCYFGDGSLGLPEQAPFDRIIVTAASPKVPQPLLDQLAPGGRLVVPIGKEDYQVMYIYKKSIDGEIGKEATDTFRFVPLIGEEGWPG